MIRAKKVDSLLTGATNSKRMRCLALEQKRFTKALLAKKKAGKRADYRRNRYHHQAKGCASDSLLLNPEWDAGLEPSRVSPRTRGATREEAT